MQHAPVVSISFDLRALPPSPPSDAATVGLAPPPVAPEALSVGVVVEGIDEDSCGHPFDKPSPDPELAAGPDHLIAVVNSSFAIFDGEGALLHGPRSFDSFFGELADCADRTHGETIENLYDPNVLYDEETDRFPMANLHIAVEGGQPEILGAAYCAAMTATADPLGVGHLHRFPMDLSAPGEVWMDFPHAGVGRDARL